MNKDEKKMLLKSAQDKISRAISEIKEATGRNERVERYLIASLEQIISDNNKWLGGGNPVTIQSLIEELDN